MIKKEIEKALNDQMNAEFYSANIYLSMSAFFESMGLPGSANWMYVQYQEEVSHAMKFFKYINSRGGKVLVGDIPAPENIWENPLKAFEYTLAHEEKVTGMINDLVALSIKENDFATNNFLQWFVAEQVEEEESANDIVNKLKLIGEDKSALFMLDNELAVRVFTPPVA